MSEKKENVPKIRFPGFTDVWEQHKLEDVVYVRSGKDYKHLSEGTIPVYGTGGYMLSVNEALSYDEDAIGIGRKGTIDRPYILKAPFWTVDTLFYATPRRNNDLNFVFDIFQRIDWKKKDESTGVPSLSKTVINDIDISITKGKEQKLIGSFFANLDQLITLHQRKLNNTQKLKSGLLQKMFPRDSENFPEIRFPGFTDAWESRKLVDILDVCSGRDYKHLQEGTIPVYGTGGYMLSVDDALSYDKDAVGIGRKGTIDKPYILRAPFWTVDTLFYAIPRNNFDLNFTYNIFQKIDWKKKDESTGVPSLSKTTINDVDVLVPEFEEQLKIGKLFSNFDNLITLHQRKIEHLQEQKKALLQQMFV
ncbi:restriction endonuclease subunit S [Anaerovorax odorimutans]|uniref:restriction endonuclease subunit S n=1 Tax=Anaerovorax odorimutans TaxID=109327 RepID=UPI000412B52A|nr:restriction endonuclease subunit S [Anaerovorax odorimutans]